MVAATIGRHMEANSLRYENTQRPTPNINIKTSHRRN